MNYETILGAIAVMTPIVFALVCQLADVRDKWAVSWNLEWKTEDFWVGIFWRKGEYNSDAWICLVPCLPLHIMLRRTRCPRCYATVKRLYTDTGGLTGCCVHCLWNPNGCRCRFGELGVAEKEGYPYCEDLP